MTMQWTEVKQGKNQNNQEINENRRNNRFKRHVKNYIQIKVKILPSNGQKLQDLAVKF